MCVCVCVDGIMQAKNRKVARGQNKSHNFNNAISAIALVTLAMWKKAQKLTQIIAQTSKALNLC